MDIVRPNTKRIRRLAWVGASVGVLLAGLGTFWYLQTVQPAAPGVVRSELWFGTVQRGTMLRSVLGHGNLEPTKAFWISAPCSGQITEIFEEAGAVLEAGTALFQIDNPDLVTALRSAETQLKLKEADLKALSARYANECAVLETAVANARASYEEAKLIHEYDEELFEEELISNLKRQRSEAEYRASITRLESAQKQLELKKAEHKIEEEAFEVVLEQQGEMLELARGQVAALTVRAKEPGVLQHIDTELGREVTRGAQLAYVVCPDKLKAVLKVPEADARELSLQQPVNIKINQSEIGGHITRIDPVVENGTVSIDVTFDSPLPPGVKPSQSISGTIEIERLENVVYVDRPASAAEEATGSVFVLSEDETKAMKTNVEYGSVSYRTIEVVHGLKEGDKIVLNDMSEWEEYRTLEIH